MAVDWTVEFANSDAESEIRGLPSDLQARFYRLIALIKSHGLEELHMPYARHLQGKLWELRLKGSSGIARSIYVAASGRRVFVLRTFMKKAQKTPREELALAARRAKTIGITT